MTVAGATTSRTTVVAASLLAYLVLALVDPERFS